MRRLLEQYNALPIQARAGIWTTVSTVIINGLNFLAMPIFTRIIPSDEYGELTVYFSSLNIILILASWDISYGAYLKGLYKYEDACFFTNTTQIFFSVSTVIWIGIIAMAYEKIFPWVAIPERCLPVVFLYILFYPSYRNMITKYNQEYEYKKSFFWTVAYASATLSVPLAAVLCIENSADIKFISQLLISIIFFAPIYFSHFSFLPQLRNFSKFREQMSYIVRFNLPCVVHSLSLVLLGQADRVMIRKYAGSREAAYYGVAYSLASVMMVIQGAMDQAMIPWRWELLKKKKYEEVRRMTNMLLLVVGAGVVFFVLLLPDVMRLVFTEEYYEAIGCMPPIAVSGFFIMLYSVFASVESYYEYTWITMAVSVICTIINIVLNYFGLQFFDYRVCAYTTLLSYILFGIGHYFGMCWVTKKEIHLKLFKIFPVLSLSVTILVLTQLSKLLYECFYVRWGIISLGVFLLFVNRKRILFFEINAH